MSGAATAPVARLLLTGDELLRGFIQDANSGFIAASLREQGIELDEIRVIGDDHETIVAALAAARADGVELVIVTGGLGPTHDDRTSEAVAASLGRDLVVFNDALEVVEARVRAYGRMRTPEEVATFAPGNRKQASMPAEATWIDPLGTAPGYVATDSGGSGSVVVVLPGPPAELRHAWTGVLETDEIAQLRQGVPARHERLLRLWGVPESRASQLLEAIGHEDSDARRITICARDGELELSVRGSDVDGVDGLTEQLREAFAPELFSIDDDRSIVAMIGDLLVASGWHLGAAESCTGGMLGSTITDAAGVSEWYRGGIVTYANEVKSSMTGVDPVLIETHGAVSEPVAAAMARGARVALGADVAVAITGVAGPGGGSDDKPVGTVHVAVVTPAGETHRAVRIPGNRGTVRRRSCVIALHEVRRALHLAADS